MFDLLTLADADLWSIAGWTMVHFLWAGALVGAAAGMCRFVLRRANANLRYVVMVAWLVVLVALPLGIAGWLARNAEPLTDREVIVAPAASDTTLVAGTAADAIIELHDPLADGGSDKQATAEPITLGTAGRTPEGNEPSLQLANPRQSLGLSDASIRSLFAVVVGRMESWITYLPWVWIIGTPITFGLLLTGVVGSRRLRRASRLVEEGPIADILSRLVESLRVTRRVTVAVCERIAAPVLIGIVRPMILLPPSALTGWSPDEIEMVLLHELAHVRRWDNFVNLLQRFVESLLFFHPAVWLVSNWVRREREACCDAVVVGRTNRPHAYAEMLVALAAQMPRSVLFHPAASSAMAAGPLRSRIRRILQVEDDPMLVSGKSLTIVLGSLLVAATLTVLYVPTIGHAEQAAAENTESTEKDAIESKPLVANEKATDEARREKESVTNMKRIALAIMNYQMAHRTLPPQAICGATGKPLLSWRVAILPFLEEADLYNEFLRDEPWDSEHNRKLIARMPSALKNPMLKEAGKSNYLAVVGVECAFDGSPAGLALRAISDGTSKTIEVVEADADQAVEWTKPQDWSFDRNNPMKGLGTAWPDGWHAAFADGFIKTFARDASPDTVGIAFTRSGGEVKNLAESAGRIAGVEGAVAGFGVEGAPGAIPGGEGGPAEVPAGAADPFGGPPARPDVQNAVPKEMIPREASAFAKAKLYSAEISDKEFAAGLNELLANGDPKKQKLLVAFPRGIDGNRENQLRTILSEYKKAGRLTEVSTAWIEGDKIEVFFEEAAAPGADPFGRPPANSYDPRTVDAATTPATNPFAANVSKETKEGDVVAEFPRSVMFEHPEKIYSAVDAAKKKKLYLDMEYRGEQVVLVIIPAPKEGDWPAMMGEPPRKERVIAEQARQRLGLKLAPLNQVEAMYQANVNGVEGLQIVGGNVPNGLPLPAILTSVNGQKVSNFDQLLSWLENERGGSPVRCHATADGKQYLFDAGPPVDKVTTRIASQAATGEGRPQTRFPSLEDQRLADSAYKRLGLELEALGADDLKRAQALGFEGGVLVVSGTAGGPHVSIQPKDVLVGLHVWPTTSMKAVSDVLDRDDVGDLNPLKFYVIRREQTGPPSAENPNESTFRDVLHTGRVSVQSGGGFGGRGGSSRSNPMRSQVSPNDTASSSSPFRGASPDSVTPKTEANSPFAAAAAPAPERVVVAYEMREDLAKQAARMIDSADGRYLWDDSGRLVVQATKETHERLSKNLAAMAKWQAAARERASKPIAVKTVDGKTLLDWRTVGLVLADQDKPGSRGVLVTDVEPGSVAAWSDLRPGDRVTRIGTFEVSSLAETQSVLETLLGGLKKKYSAIHLNWTRVKPDGRNLSLSGGLRPTPDAPPEGDSTSSDIAPRTFVDNAPLAPAVRPFASDPAPAADERSVLVDNEPLVSASAPPAASVLPTAPLATRPPLTAPGAAPIRPAEDVWSSAAPQPPVAPRAVDPLTGVPSATAAPKVEPAAGIVPPAAADDAELDVLRERLRTIEQQYKQTEVLYKEGRRGGSAEVFATQGYELALAKGELALAEGKLDKAIEELQDAAKRAQDAVDAVQSQYKADRVTYDVVLQAIRNLSDIKLKLIRLQKMVRAETAPAYSPASTQGTSVLPNPPSVAAPVSKSNLRYDGKTFGTWRDTWKTELSTEKRLEAIKALAAFARAGYGKEAVEAILDVAGEYDFYILDSSLEGKLKEVVLDELAPGDRKQTLATYWVAGLSDRFGKYPKQWKWLTVMLLSRLQTDDPEVLGVLRSLAETNDSQLRAEVLSALVRAGRSRDASPPLDEATRKLVDSALASDDSDFVHSTLLSLMYSRQEMGGLGENTTFRTKLVYRPSNLPLLLFHKDEHIQLQARRIAKLLDRKDADELVKQLTDVLKDPSRVKDRIAAMRTLAALGDKGKNAIPVLIEMFKTSDDVPTRVAAMVALVHCSGKKAVLEGHSNFNFDAIAEALAEHATDEQRQQVIDEFYAPNEALGSGEQRIQRLTVENNNIVPPESQNLGGGGFF